MLSFVLFSIPFILFQRVFSTVLNIEELNSIHYNIDIINNPVLKNQEWTTNIVTIINKHGQEYICTLPEVQIPENESKKEEDLLDHLVDISELLKPMEVAPCLNKKKDWWSYEFCYGSVIKQYHLEDNKVVGTILILGKYESEYNWRNNTKSKNKLRKFHTQYYVNGTRCDITGEPRRAEVRFHCEEGIGDYIQQVDEPESCRYVIVIATTRVCHHPYLKPNPNRTPYNINCAPALNQEEFSQYQKIQEMKESKVDLAHSLHLDEKSTSDQEATRDDVNLVGSDATGKDSGISIDEEDSHFSIRLVTIPVPPNRGERNILKSGMSGLVLEATEDDATVSTNKNSIDSISPEENSSLRDNDESVHSISADDQKLTSSSSYLNLNKRLEKEFMKMQGKETKEERKGKEDQSVDNGETKGELLRLFATYITQINKVEEEWIENQSEKNPMNELLDTLKTKLYKYMENIEKVINKYSESNFFNYFESLIEILDKYMKLLKAKYSKLENKEQVMEMLQSMITFLSELDLKLLNAFQKMKFNRMEKYLDAHLKGKDVEHRDNPLVAQVEGDKEIEMEPTKESSSDSSQPLLLFLAEQLHLISNPSKDQVMGENESEESGEDQIADPDEGHNTKEGQADTQDVQILNENPLNSDRKIKLEQSIKERLEKSGLDNIGRKIEIKILTPNYLDDDEKNTQSSLSQEETEAFHNMIVNILSASAEELKERERHKNLESSYNFRLEQVKETTPNQVEDPETQNMSPEKNRDNVIDDNDANQDDLL